MAEIAAAFLAPVVEVVKWVGKPIMRQFNYLCCYTTNINSLKDEAQNLDDATKELEMAVQRETNNLQCIVPAVTTWLRKSNDLKDEITGILSEAANKETGCSKLGVRFSLSKRAKKMTDRIKGFRGEKNFDVISLPGRPPAEQTIPLEKTYEFPSRKKIEEDIMTTVKDGNVSLIGIHGMGGLGKTTLAKKISTRVLDEHVFQAVTMVVVSQEPSDYSQIQVQIGTNLGLNLRDDTSQGRAQKLHAKLSGTGTGAKRTLLILDDVWKMMNLKELGIPCDSKWCTILVTSRDTDTLTAMGCEGENKFGMKILHDKEAWDLFSRTAGPCVDDARLNSIAKEVVKKCGGLPIALVVVGLALKDKANVSIWENALRELKQCDLDIHGYMNEVYTPLKWSFDFLKSKKAQSLCLLCCLFPEDYDIPLKCLTYFCMGLGILEGIGDLKGARNKVSSLIDFLKGRSLLLDSDESGCVKMHDVVRDVFIVIAKKEGYIGHNDSIWISSSHLSKERNGFPNLRLLFLSRYFEKKSEFDTTYHEEIRDLHVLCIEYYSFTKIIPHPQSLTKLKTLILDSCEELKTISFVGQLVNLEILICRFCDWIEELPQDMKKLKRLKLLKLTNCRKLRSIGRGIISGLVELEELKIYGSFNKWEAEDREDRENAALRELEYLKKLTCLKIEIEDPTLAAENMHLMSKFERFRIRIGEYLYLPSNFDKKMSLYLNREIHLGNWIEKQLIRDTECLNLSGDGTNNVDLANLRNIKWLKLSNCRKSITISSVVDDDVFCFMEYLELENLPQLQEICDSPVWFQNLKGLILTKLPALNNFWNSNQNNLVPIFSNLSYIHIRHCHSLRNVEQLSLAGTDCLPQLQKLSIEECEMMEMVFLCINLQVIRKVFLQLKELKLVGLPNLETFYQGIQGIEFPLLTKLTIDRCPKMKSITNIIGRNQNKSGERINSSASAGANINDGDFSHYFCQSEKVSFGSLKVLKIDHNPICRDEIPSSLFNGLKELTIDKYEGNISIFTLSIARNLVNLRKLDIMNCDDMLKVIEIDEQVASDGQRILLFPKLKLLRLSHLPKLVRFCDCKCEVELPLLRSVQIVKCPNMENLSLGFVTAPALKEFATDLPASYVEVAFGVGVPLRIEENEHPFHHDSISVSLFNRLENLTFYGSKGVVSLVSSSVVENLVNLKSLKIANCDEMLVTVIKDNEVEEDEKVMSKGSTVVFPKLERISLIRLNKLESFCEWKCYIKLPSLRKLHIWDCPNIERFSLGYVDAPKLKTISRYTDEDVDACEDLNSFLQQHYLARQKVQLNEEEEGGEEEQERKGEIEEGGEEEQERKGEIEEEQQDQN